MVAVMQIECVALIQDLHVTLHTSSLLTRG